MDAWLSEWSASVRPLRERFGFAVDGVWVAPTDHRFVWLLSHPGDFHVADRAYYESPERHALDPDPARHIEAADVLMVEMFGLAREEPAERPA
jgi:hypothetical protein